MLLATNKTTYPFFVQLVARHYLTVLLSARFFKAVREELMPTVGAQCAQDLKPEFFLNQVLPPLSYHTIIRILVTLPRKADNPSPAKSYFDNLRSRKNMNKIIADFCIIGIPRLNLIFNKFLTRVKIR